MPNRVLNPGAYSFGFNGQLKNPEIDEGNYDFGSRIYNSKISRFFSVDRFEHKFPSISPYLFASNSPIYAKDINGDSTYIIVYVNTDEFYTVAATRRDEIEKKPWYNPARDHVYMVEVSDISELIEQIPVIVADANEKGFGHTKELDFYTHGGGDGPVGSVPTRTLHSLFTETGSRFDEKQMRLSSWQMIDWNFDPDNSIANFYGCSTTGFAELFLQATNVFYTAGMAGTTGDSESPNIFDANWFHFGEDLWQMQVLVDDIQPTMDIYRRRFPNERIRAVPGNPFWVDRYRITNVGITTNATTTNNGGITGHTETEGGTQRVEANDQEFAN